MRKEWGKSEKEGQGRGYERGWGRGIGKDEGRAGGGDDRGGGRAIKRKIEEWRRLADQVKPAEEEGEGG